MLVEAGQRLAGRYKVIERLGRGGMGEVWKALDEHLQRPVAVKVLRDGVESDQAVARFRREATIGARLRHPGITTVYDVGRDADRLFLVMELLEGRDLAALLADAPDGLPVGEAVQLAVQIVDALAAAHDQGVVHRDLKPANVFLHEGRVKLCDFGISRATDSTTGLTGTGQPFGTPPYMAPEQWRGEHIDARCDLYTLGCLLHAMLTGIPPFAGDYYALMHQHTNEPPQPLRRYHPEIPEPLEKLVLGLLAKDPQLRPTDAHTVHTALTTLSNTPQPDPGPAQSSTTLVTDLLDEAETAGGNGDRVRAVLMAFTAAEVATRVLGPDHPDTLTARHDHAYWTGAAGDDGTARDLYKAVTDDRTRVLGPDHPDTLTTRHNHAWWTGGAGDHGTARDLLHTVATDRSRALGPDHPDTLTTRDDHAQWTGFADDAETARDLLHTLAADRTRVLGPEHPDTLNTRHNHAWWTGDAGDAETARDLFHTVATDRTRVLGPDHPDTLGSWHNHAHWVGVAERAAG
ncbi:protein kinase domain-containing protein [Streptomyces sp. NPDC002073]